MFIILPIITSMYYPASRTNLKEMLLDFSIKQNPSPRIHITTTLVNMKEIVKSNDFRFKSNKNPILTAFNLFYSKKTSCDNSSLIFLLIGVCANRCWQPINHPTIVNQGNDLLDVSNTGEVF